MLFSALEKKVNLMYNNLDATNFNGSISFYDTNFEGILSKITDCYHKLISDYSTIENDENKIRDILLLKYLKNDEIREEVGLIDLYNFEREVPEDESEGRTDIKITTRDTFIKQKAYYTIECKRLDNTNTTGASGLNAKYVSNGIGRFTSRKYSSYYCVNAMMGFIVEKLDIHQNTEDINTLLKINNTINTTKKITISNFIKNYDYHYNSEHIDKNNQKLRIYHLMYDFSQLIN
jgi:hypothetical protein